MLYKINVSKTERFEDQKFLNGERIISLEIVGISKCEEPILAEKSKKVATERIHKKVKNQENPSKIVIIFHIGGFLSGCLENQYSGMYKSPCAQFATVLRAWTHA